MRTMKDILDHARKGTNAAYQGVVKGKRPSRKAKAEQQKLSQYSRQGVTEYWAIKLAELEAKNREK